MCQDGSGHSRPTRAERGITSNSTFTQRRRTFTIQVPVDYQTFEREIRIRIHRLVMSDTPDPLPSGPPIRRERELVNDNQTLREVWHSISSAQGRTVTIIANLIWGDYRIERIDFTIDNPITIQSRGTVPIPLPNPNLISSPRPVVRNPTPNSGERLLNEIIFVLQLPETIYSSPPPSYFKFGISFSGSISLQAGERTPSSDFTRLRVQYSDRGLRAGIQQQVERKINDWLRFRVQVTTDIQQGSGNIINQLRQSIQVAFRTDHIQLAIDSSDFRDAFFLRVEFYNQFAEEIPISSTPLRFTSPQITYRIRIGLTPEAAARIGQLLLRQLRPLVSTAVLEGFAFVVATLAISAAATYAFLLIIRDAHESGHKRRLGYLYAQGYISLVYSVQIVELGLTGIWLNAQTYGVADARTDIQRRGIERVKSWLVSFLGRGPLSDEEIHNGHILSGQMVIAMGDYLASGGIPFSSERY